MKKAKIRWNRLALVVAVAVGACFLALYLLDAAVPLLRSGIGGLFWSSDPQHAQQVAARLLDFDPPPGYQFLMASKDANIPIVIMAHGGRPSDLIEIEQEHIADRSNPEEVLQMELLWSREVGYQRYETERVGTYTVDIRGQPTEVAIREGQDGDGLPVRQVIAFFTGKDGDVVVVLVGRLDAWDQAMVDQFFASIR